MSKLSAATHGLGGGQAASFEDYAARRAIVHGGQRLAPSQPSLSQEPSENLLLFRRPIAEAPQAPSESDEELFRRLAGEWRANRGLASSPTRMATRPEYQRIIGMGSRALPLILAELEREPDHWFWALGAITGENPVPSESRGNIREMTRTWLEWGRRNVLHTSRSVR